MARPILQLKASKEEVAEPYHADIPFNFTDNDPELATVCRDLVQSPPAGPGNAIVP